VQSILLELILTSDVNHVVNAQLSFGTSTSAFTLNFSGTAAGIENTIEAGFANGSLSGDLNDLLTVGFVPSTSVQAYTFGTRTTLDVGSIEVVPEPGTRTFLLGGLGAMLFISKFALRVQTGS